MKPHAEFLEAAPKFDAPAVWLQGKRTQRIPGSITGVELQSPFNDAVKTIYDSSETNPVAFSHGLAILYWVLMTVKNPVTSLADQPLLNAARVVITGNPTDGWTLVDRKGTPVPAPR
jgi:hypothetical protein